MVMHRKTAQCFCQCQRVLTPEPDAAVPLPGEMPFLGLRAILTHKQKIQRETWWLERATTTQQTSSKVLTI